MYNPDAVDGMDNPFKPSKRLQRTPPKGAPTEATKARQETVGASQIRAPSTSKEKEEVSIIKETPFGVTANETVAYLQLNSGLSTAPAPTISLCDIQQPEAPAAAEKIVDHPSKMVEASDVAPAAAEADIEKVTACPPSSTDDPEKMATKEGVETLGVEEHKVEEKEGEVAAATALPAEHVPDQASSKEESLSTVAVASQTCKEVASTPIEEMSTTNLATNAAAAVHSSTEIDIDDDNNVEAEASAGAPFGKAVNEDSSPPTTVMTEEKKAPLHPPVAAEPISPPASAVVPWTTVLPPSSELPAVVPITTNSGRSSSKPEETFLTPSIVPSSSTMYAGGMIPTFSLRDVTQSLRLRTPTVSFTPVSAAAIAAPQELTSQPKEEPQQEIYSQPQEQLQQKEEGQRQEEVQAAGKQQAAVMSSPAAISSPAPMEMEVANPFVPRPKVGRTPPPANACQVEMEQSLLSSPTQTTTSVCSSPVIAISTAALSPVPMQMCPEEAATISNPPPIKRVAESYSKAMPIPTTCASSSAAACQTYELDLPQLLTVKKTLTRQETELQEELDVLRSDLIKQKVQSERLMESWSQAQAALKNSGQELDGVQRERRRLSVNLSRLTKELTLTKEHIKPLVGEGDAAREELWQLKLEQLGSCNELTGSVCVFDRLCERERRLKIKLLHEEAASYEVRSAYLKDYKVMCDFSRNVTFKALELANRVKERVDQLKEVFKAQQGELQRKIHDADMQAKEANEARNHDMSRLEEMQSREAEHEKAVQRLEKGKCKAEKRLAEAEGKADKEVKKLEALLSNRSEEIKRLEAEVKQLRSQDVPKVPTNTKVSKQKKNRPEMETQDNEMLSTLSKSADLPGGDDELLDNLDQSSQASSPSSSTPPPGKESKKGGSRKKRQAVTSDEEGPIPAVPGGKDSRKKRATSKAKKAVVETVVNALEEEKGDNEGETALQTFSPCKPMEDEMMAVEETSLPSLSPQAVAADNECTSRSRGRKREDVSEGEKGAEPAGKRGWAQQRKKGHAIEVPAMEDPDPVVSMAVEKTADPEPFASAPAPSPLRQISSNEQEVDAAIEPTSTKRSTAMNSAAAAAAGNENDQNQQRNEAPRPPVAHRPLPPLKTNVAKPQTARDKIKTMSIFAAFMDKKAIPALKKPT